MITYKKSKVRLLQSSASLNLVSNGDMKELCEIQGANEVDQAGLSHHGIQVSCHDTAYSDTVLEKVSSMHDCHEPLDCYHRTYNPSSMNLPITNRDNLRNTSRETNNPGKSDNEVTSSYIMPITVLCLENAYQSKNPGTPWEACSNYRDHRQRRSRADVRALRSDILMAEWFCPSANA